MKTKIITTLVALGLFTAACKDDYLETVPTASVDAQSAYATTKNASAAINGIYRAMVVRYLSLQNVLRPPRHDDYHGRDGRGFGVRQHLQHGATSTSNAGLVTARTWVRCRSLPTSCTTGSSATPTLPSSASTMPPGHRRTRIRSKARLWGCGRSRTLT